MNELLDELKKGPLCIYGCGECGIQIYFLLKESGIHINFFCDRDKSKKGYVMDGVSCITYEELLRMEAQDAILIIGIAHGEGLVDEFRELGFKKVFYYVNIRQELYAELLKAQEKKSLLEIEDLQRLKQNIQEIANSKELSMKSKREGIIMLCDKKQRRE